LAIVLSGLLRLTDSDYPFGIFKHFLQREKVGYWGILFLFWPDKDKFYFLNKEQPPSPLPPLYRTHLTTGLNQNHNFSEKIIYYVYSISIVLNINTVLLTDPFTTTTDGM
jgi:hypothetical protein